MRKLAGIIFIIILLISFSFAHSPMAQEKKESAGEYTIKQGDTLWDISSKFLKNPFLWPKLWQRNPYITNPHWIYPGKSLRLSPGEEVRIEEPKKVVVEEKPKEIIKEPEAKKEEPLPLEKKPEVVVVEAKPIKPIPIKPKPIGFPDIRSAGFMSDIDYKGLGIILENKEGKNLMAEGDIVYLAFRSSEPIQKGDKYTVFRSSEIIRHPITDQRVGRRFNITGNVQIIDQERNFYTAKVIEAFDAILKGDMIQPYLKEKMEVEESKE